MSTHNLCFRAKIRKHLYPCKPQFYYIKVGCKGVYITRTCYHDAVGIVVYTIEKKPLNHSLSGLETLFLIDV